MLMIMFEMRSDMDSHVTVRGVQYLAPFSFVGFWTKSLLLQECPLLYPCYVHFQSSSLSVSQETASVKGLQSSAQMCTSLPALLGHLRGKQEAGRDIWADNEASVVIMIHGVPECSPQTHDKTVLSVQVRAE